MAFAVRTSIHRQARPAIASSRAPAAPVAGSIVDRRARAVAVDTGSATLLRPPGLLHERLRSQPAGAPRAAAVVGRGVALPAGAPFGASAVPPMRAAARRPAATPFARRVNRRHPLSGRRRTALINLLTTQILATVRIHTATSESHPGVPGI
jgi:hypothetical protein